MVKERKQLVLKKSKEKYVFRYDVGCEDQLMEALVHSASDSQTDFDWFDAAVLSFKLTQSLIFEADEILDGYCNEGISG